SAAAPFLPGASTASSVAVAVVSATVAGVTETTDSAGDGAGSADDVWAAATSVDAAGAAGASESTGTSVADCLYGLRQGWMSRAGTPKGTPRERSPTKNAPRSRRFRSASAS